MISTLAILGVLAAARGGPGETAKINGCPVRLADQAGTKGMFHHIDGFLFKP